jgi:hypothetical protein
MKDKQFNDLIKDLSDCDKCTHFKCPIKSLINIYKNYVFVLILLLFGLTGLID